MSNTDEQTKKLKHDFEYACKIFKDATKAAYPNKHVWSEAEAELLVNLLTWHPSVLMEEPALHLKPVRMLKTRV